MNYLIFTRSLKKEDEKKFLDKMLKIEQEKVNIFESHLNVVKAVAKAASDLAEIQAKARDKHFKKECKTIIGSKDWRKYKPLVKTVFPDQRNAFRQLLRYGLTPLGIAREMSNYINLSKKYNITLNEILELEQLFRSSKYLLRTHSDEVKKLESEE